jgi:CO/xanthine dehydrogenase Mo-binding subunit
MPQDGGGQARHFKIVGTRPQRPDGIDKVTGKARFGADMVLPGMLIGLVLRSPHAHARIRTIDTKKAEALAGVKAVITSADLPDHTNGDRGLLDTLENIMARGKAMYDGHAVAAVAAIDAGTAREALKLIKVDYDVLPHVTDVEAHHRGRDAKTLETVERREPPRVRPRRCGKGLQGGRRGH